MKTCIEPLALTRGSFFLLVVEIFEIVFVIPQQKFPSKKKKKEIKKKKKERKNDNILPQTVLAWKFIHVFTQEDNQCGLSILAFLILLPIYQIP